MVSRNRDGQGDALAIFRSRDVRREPLTTSEVAEALGCSRRVAVDRLEQLAANGILEAKEIEARDRVWWKPKADGPTEVPEDEGDDTERFTDYRPGGEPSGVLLVDDDGDIAWIDRTAATLFDVTGEDVIGKDRDEFVRAVLAERVEDATVVDEIASGPDEAAEREAPLEFEFRDGERGPSVRLEYASKQIESGRYAGGRAEFFTDVADRSLSQSAGDDQEHLFQSLVEATEEYAVTMLDPDGHVIRWNRGGERLTGYAESDVLGEHFSTFYPDEAVDAGVPSENLSAAIEDESVEDEGWRVRADGTRFWASVSFTAICDDGELRGFAWVMRDMTDRRERDHERETEQELLEGILETIPVSVGVISPEGEFVLSNRRADDRLGTENLDEPRYQVGIRDVYDEDGEFVPPEERPYVRAFETGEPVEDWHCQIDLPDHGRRWLSINSVPVTDDDGEVEQVIVTGDDISHLKEQASRLERKRDELENELDDVFERVSNAFYGLDENWRFTYVNDRAEELLGRSESELLGASIWDEFEEAVGSRFEAKYRAAIETQEPVHFEEDFPPLDGRFEVDAYPSESGLSVYFNDVTERKERERELERYERIVENVPIGVYRNTPGSDGAFVEGNPELASIFDADSVADLIGSPVSELYPDPEQRAEFSQRLEREGVVEDFELKQETLEGRPIWISVTAIKTEEDGQVYFDGVVQDVTERRERERELERYETLFEESQDVNAVIEPDGTYSYLTPSTERVLGYDPGELVGENAFDYVHPEDQEEIWDHFSKVIEDPDYSPLVELRFRHADGSWVVLEAQARNFLDDPEIDGIVAYTRDATDRKLFEETLQALHESSRELIRAQNKTEVSQTVVDAATSVLDLPGVVIYRHDEAADVLTLDEKSIDANFMREALPDFPIDHSSIVGHTFCDGEQKYYEDVVESDHLMADPDEVDMSAGLFVPLGDHGVLVVGWPGEDACDDRTRQLIEILSANAEAAYTRVEREHELEEAERRYRTLAENFPNGAVGVYDHDLRYELVEGAIWDNMEPSAEDLEGNTIHEVFSEDVTDDIEPIFRAAVEEGETESVLTELVGRTLRIWATPLRDSDGEIFAGLSYAQDVTEQIERERKLEESRQRYGSIVENFPNGAIALVDQDLRYATVGGSPRDLVDVSAEELEGKPVEEVLEPELADELVPRYRRALAGEASQFERELGDRVFEFRVIPVRNESGEVFAATGMSQDVTAQVQYQRELEAKARQQEVVADLGQRALGTDDLDALFDEAVELITETLDSEYCKVLDLDRDSEDLLLRAGVGLPEDHVGSATVDIGRESQAGYTLLADEPIVVENMAAEDRFTGPDRLMGSDVDSGISAVIGSRASPWGVLATHDTDHRDFSEDDALFVQSVANILANAIDRRNNEVELEDQREHLAALNNLNSVVRDINEALVEQSTREEIERTVCERLADSDSYQFAYTAEVDPRTEFIEPRIEAGVDGYIEDADIRIDEDLPAGQGPVGRAARSREIHVTHDTFSDPTFEPWRDVAEKYGYRSCAAIPIVYQDTLYGILGIYTDRIGAFADEEQEVVAQLGEVIGHAIASIERKQALMSDDVVEIDIRIENVLQEAGLTESMEGEIWFTEAVSVGDGTFLQYGTTAEGALETVESLVDHLPHWDQLTVLGDETGETRFELQLSEPPVISTIADNGGYIDEAVIENGTMHMTIHLPPTVDVRRVVSAIQESYSTAKMVTRQQVSRNESQWGIEQTLTEELTDRQRAALEASFHAGFFDWPRESSGEEVAESLDVSAPTFHQHLRKAQQKLLESILT